jgi:hypothetical protein
MSESEFAISLKTNRLVRKSTANYRKLKKLNLVKEIDLEPPKTMPEPSPVQKKPEPTPAPEFDEKDLQVRMADLTTNMVADNMKQIIKNQKLSDAEYDILLKQMLYQKLCMTEPKPKKPSKPPKKAKKRFKIVEPSSSSESESD